MKKPNIRKCVRCETLIRGKSKYCFSCMGIVVTEKKHISRKKLYDRKKAEAEFLEKIKSLAFNGNNGESWNGK